MQQAKWFDRTFHFDSTENIFPSLIERLSGTPIRLEEKLRFIPPAMLTIRLEDSWSIKENIGHLTDLEPLWQGRLQDILDGKPALRPTDLQNTRTSTAGHNATPLAVLLDAFRTVRLETMGLIKSITPEQVFLSALHPRLGTPMRTMDHILFVAEHDDHHLARMTAIQEALKQAPSEEK